MPQNLSNHRRVVPVFHLGVYVLLAAYLVHAIRKFLTSRTPDAFYEVILGVVVALVAFYARAFALKVQDRVIRLEMRLRLQMLAPELAAQFGRFTPAQLVALRFAGDQELAGLARNVLDGRHASPTEIKQQIRDWQPDEQRA